MSDVLVIGAGAAGIIAAWKAAKLGAKVRLLEKTDRIGTKILISGGGKCNIAHDGDLESVLRAFRPNEARFIRPACYRFPNSEIVEMLTSRGLEVYTRDDGRIFPVHQTAKDVVAILRGYLHEAGVEVLMNTPVTGVESRDGRMTGVYSRDQFYPSAHVVLATGGSSYPNSGTTGDGWPWARQLGHTVVKVRAALAPMYLELLDRDPRAGVAVRGALLKARQNGKEIARWQQDLLFTHRGVSGPSVLGISRVVAERWEEGAVTLELDLRPDTTFEGLSETIVDYAKAHPKRTLATFLGEMLPDSLVDDVAESAGIEASRILAQLDRKARNRLIETLKGWSLGRVRTVPIEKGEVVAGGISLTEVDPQTMKSKYCQGLYLCGEVLDIAGPVGGYNLQAAFATGFVAGETAAQEALDHHITWAPRASR